MPEREYPPAAFCAATGKVSHPSRKVAVANLRRVLRGLDGAARDRKERGKLTVYRCACGSWHVGNHSPEDIRRDKSKRRQKPPPEIEDAA